MNLVINSNGSSYTQCSVDAKGLIESSTCNTVTPSGTGALAMPYGIYVTGNSVTN